ncbi:MAG: ankyrin repeat domain-containing protein [Bacteroidota bacterium]
MNRYLLAILLLLPLFIAAQDSNIFHDRSYWESAPDVNDVKSEIKKGNDPVALTPSAFDAITYAILANAPLETISYLLSIKGNGVDKMTHDKRNYLMWAAYKGNIELMQLLIDMKSQTDIIDDHGYNLMTFAAVAGMEDTGVYDLLLANGAKVTDSNRSGANALLLLSPNLKDQSLISYFKEKGLDIHTKDHDGNGMFHYAARKGNIETLQMLIEMGLDYSTKSTKGENAITFASAGSRGHVNSVDVYEFLEDLGLEVNVVTTEGESPLHNIAYRAKDREVLSYFLEKGVDPNQVDEEGNTAFLNAMRGNNMAMAELLQPHVTDINHRNKDGYSALTYAVMRNSEDGFGILLAAGADIKVLDNKDRNLVYHMFNAFNERSKKVFQEFLTQAKKHELNLTPSYEGGNTLAHLAVKKEQAFLLKQALDLGVEINQKNEEGLTPLHLAAMQAKNKEILTVMLKHGADKSILTDFDESAFDLASENEVLSNSGIDLDFLKADSGE